jgi:hypothetical protein
MKTDGTTLVMAGLVAVLSLIACLYPIIDTSGTGQSRITSIRGEEVILHGVGPYRHMPADVAIQGLAQDLFSLVVAIPLLVAGTILSSHLSCRAQVPGLPWC